MNQEIPKPLRNALARQAVGDVHPSPDVLTSFVERTLAAGESEVVTHHLAQCAECREIVFLASNAAEDEVGDGRRLVAAAAAWVERPPCPATPLLHAWILLGLRGPAFDGQFEPDGPSRLRLLWCLSRRGWFCSSGAPPAEIRPRRSRLPAIVPRRRVHRRSNPRPLQVRRSPPRRPLFPRCSLKLRQG